jgi:hypothetical protein
VKDINREITLKVNENLKINYFNFIIEFLFENKLSFKVEQDGKYKKIIFKREL